MSTERWGGKDDIHLARLGYFWIYLTPSDYLDTILFYFILFITNPLTS